MPDADLASTLAGIRERQALAADKGLGFARMGERHAALLAVAYEDAPVLIAAVDAALKAADDWDVPGECLNDDMSDPNTQARDCARELRAAITAALTGKEADDGDRASTTGSPRGSTRASIKHRPEPQRPHPGD